jgi:hypothetical protein
MRNKVNNSTSDFEEVWFARMFSSKEIEIVHGYKKNSLTVVQATTA